MTVDPVNATVESVASDAHDALKHLTDRADWSEIWKASFSARLWDLPEDCDGGLDLWEES